MEVSDRLHVPTAFPRKRLSLIMIILKVRWTREQVWAWWHRQKPLPLAEIEPVALPAASHFTVRVILALRTLSHLKYTSR